MGETEKPIRVAQIMGKLWAGGVEAGWYLIIIGQ